MTRNFKDLQDKMGPERLAKAHAKANEMMAEMLLVEICRLTGRPEEEAAASLGVKQPTLSRLESQDDMQISTLNRLIKALGGELELIAHLPGGDIRINQFTDAA